MRAAWSLALLLAACTAEEAPAPPPERDPASEQALNDQIMIDPDLANQNEANAALTVSSDHSLPLIVATDAEVAAARAEAAALTSGAQTLVSAPTVRALDDGDRGEIVTLQERAAALPGASRCLRAATRSAAWAARLPGDFPVYPRGATQAVIGTDADRCALRGVRFVTPVALGEVLAFYAARARQRGFAFEHAAGGGRHRLSGRKGAAVFLLDLGSTEDGLTEADLVTARL